MFSGRRIADQKAREWAYAKSLMEKDERRKLKQITRTFTWLGGDKEWTKGRTSIDQRKKIQRWKIDKNYEEGTEKGEEYVDNIYVGYPKCLKLMLMCGYEHKKGLGTRLQGRPDAIHHEEQIMFNQGVTPYVHPAFLKKYKKDAAYHGGIFGRENNDPI